MHWDSRDIKRTMKLAMLETHYRVLTNKDEPNNFYYLTQRALCKMSEDKLGSGGFK